MSHRVMLESEKYKLKSVTVIKSVRPMLRDNVRNAHARVNRAMAFRAPLALPALLLEDPDFRPARLAVDDAHHLGAGHKRRAGDELAAVLGEKQHLLEGHVRAAFARGAGNLHRR